MTEFEGWDTLDWRNEVMRLRAEVARLREALDQPKKSLLFQAQNAETRRDEMIEERDAARAEVERLRAEARWIPCSEGISLNTELLVYGRYLFDDPQMLGETACFTDDGSLLGWDSEEPIHDFTVTHWRPRPDPPEVPE